MYTKAGQKAVDKYVKNNYDNIITRVHKGDREKIKAFAESKGMSLQGFIKQAIDKEMNSPTE